MNLDALPGGIAVAAAFVRPGDEAQSLIVRHGGVEVMDGEDRRDPLQGAHGASFAWSSLRSAVLTGRCPRPSVPKRLWRRGWSRRTECRASAISAIDVVSYRHFGAASTRVLRPRGDRRSEEHTSELQSPMY